MNPRRRPVRIAGTVCALAAGTPTEADMREIELFAEFLRAAKQFGVENAYQRVYGQEAT